MKEYIYLPPIGKPSILEHVSRLARRQSDADGRRFESWSGWLQVEVTSHQSIPKELRCFGHIDMVLSIIMFFPSSLLAIKFLSFTMMLSSLSFLSDQGVLNIVECLNSLKSQIYKIHLSIESNLNSNQWVAQFRSLVSLTLCRWSTFRHSWISP